MQIIDLVPDLVPVILAAREARDANNTLAQFLPNTPVADIRYRMGRGRRLDQTVPVRAIDAPATPIRQPGLVTMEGELPAITPIVNLSEQDLTNQMILAQEMAGLPVDYTPSVEAGAVRGALTIDNTLEVMRGQLLSTGLVSLTVDDGSTHTVDFEVPDEQKFTAATAWTNDAADPFEELDAWHEAFVTAYGTEAGVLLTSRRVARLLQNRLQAMYPAQVVGPDTLSGYLAAKGLPAIATYDRTLRNNDGSATRVFPSDVVTFLPGADAPIGRTELGITQEARQQVGRGILTAAQAPGITIVTLGSDNPVQRAVKAAAIGLPVLRDVDGIVIADGLFG